MPDLLHALTKTMLLTPHLFRTGNLDPDEDGDCWGDTVDNMDQPLDYEYMEKEYTDLFKWDCCNALGNKNGCKNSPHRETRKKPKSDGPKTWQLPNEPLPYYVEKDA